MELTPAQIRDYEACARFYDFKHIQNLKERKGTRAARTAEFEEAIYRVINYFLYKKQAFSDPTLNSLWNRWQRDWYGDMTASDIAKMSNSIQQRSKTAYGTRALEVMKEFYDEFKNVRGDQIFWLNEDYIVPILDKKVNLTGKVDLVVRQKKEGRFHIYKWVNSLETANYWKYDLAAADYAFKYRYNFKNIETKHFTWSFLGAKIGSTEVELDRKDFQTMGYWADQITNDEIFMSRYGYSTYCKNCPFESACQHWELKNER